VKFACAVAAFLFFNFLAPGLAKDQVPQPSVASIGLQTGQRAPAFNLLDQFGREQSNETLRGSCGTVVLFFRSADW
jgi:hypothetical protein